MLTETDAPVARSSILDRFVSRIDVLTSSNTELRAIDYLPDGSSYLVFRWLGGDKADLSVRGPLLHAHYKLAPSIPLAVRVVFRPGGAYPFFGLPLSELAGRLQPLDDLWASRARQLFDELLARCQRGEDVTPAIRRALLDRLRSDPFEPSSAMVAHAAMRHLGNDRRSIEGIATDLGISERHLRRTFLATVGMAPKTYARIARFQRALRRAESGVETWAEIAQETGYFDQAHLVSEFRDLALESPEAFVRARASRDRRVATEMRCG